MTQAIWQQAMTSPESRYARQLLTPREGREHARASRVNRNTSRLQTKDPPPLRPTFSSERNREFYSQASHRKVRNTQVWFVRRGDYYQDGSTYPPQQTEFAPFIGGAKFLNEYSFETIKLSDYLSQSPIARTGAAALTVLIADFRFNKRSVIEVDHSEQSERGHKWTGAVRNGRLGHSNQAAAYNCAASFKPASVAGESVRIAEQAADANCDSNDAFSGFLDEPVEISFAVVHIFGVNCAGWIDTLAGDMFDLLRFNTIPGVNPLEKSVWRVATLLCASLFESDCAPVCKSLNVFRSRKVVRQLADHTFAEPPTGALDSRFQLAIKSPERGSPTSLRK